MSIKRREYYILSYIFNLYSHHPSLVTVTGYCLPDTSLLSKVLQSFNEIIAGRSSPKLCPLQFFITPSGAYVQPQTKFLIKVRQHFLSTIIKPKSVYKSFENKEMINEVSHNNFIVIKVSHVILKD